ncbi:MAG: hypothetical protein AAB729_05345 [Patescibacteria group bacterium]
MDTITITKKEYNALVFSKKAEAKKTSSTKGFFAGGFGALKKSFGKGSSVAYVNKLRKSWR